MAIELIAAFFASFFFGLLFKIPPKNLFSAGLVGTVGWLAFASTRGFSVVLAAFIAAIIIGLFSEVFARSLKKPVTIFVIPGIVPLVPGAGAYYTMIAFMKEDFATGISKGAETLLVAGAIAAGIAFVGAMFRMFKERIKSVRKG